MMDASMFEVLNAAADINVYVKGAESSKAKIPEEFNFGCFDCGHHNGFRMSAMGQYATIIISTYADEFNEGEDIEREYGLHVGFVVNPQDIGFAERSPGWMREGVTEARRRIMYTTYQPVDRYEGVNFAPRLVTRVLDGNLVTLEHPANVATVNNIVTTQMNAFAEIIPDADLAGGANAYYIYLPVNGMYYAPDAPINPLYRFQQGHRDPAALFPHLRFANADVAEYFYRNYGPWGNRRGREDGYNKVEVSGQAKKKRATTNDWIVGNADHGDPFAVNVGLRQAIDRAVDRDELDLRPRAARGRMR